MALLWNINNQGFLWLMVASFVTTIISFTTLISNSKIKKFFNKKNNNIFSFKSFLKLSTDCQYINISNKDISYKIEGEIDINSIEFKTGINHVINGIVPGANKVTLDDFDIRSLSGGISNLLFVANIKPLNLQVIIRLYGEGTSRFVNRDTENIIFRSLSEARISPICYGTFLNGRIEQYLPNCRSLLPEETKDPYFIALISNAVSELHSTQINISTNICGWEKLENLLYLAEETINVATQELELGTSSSRLNSKFLNKDTVSIHRISITNILKEYLWLKSTLSSYSNSSSFSYSASTLPFVTESNEISTETEIPLGVLFGMDKVLSHNDLLSGNMLYITNETSHNQQQHLQQNQRLHSNQKKLTLIDFEYSGYNYRAWDIANHFCEAAGFQADFLNDFPDFSTRILFYINYIQSYMKYWHKWKTNVDSNTHTNSEHYDNENKRNISMDFQYICSLLSNKTIEKKITNLLKDNPNVMKTEKYDDEVTNEISFTMNNLFNEQEKKIIQFLKDFDNIVCKFTLASHLFWGAWAIIQAANSKIDFDFSDYSLRRHEGYLYHKKTFFSNEHNYGK